MKIPSSRLLLSFAAFLLALSPATPVRAGSALRVPLPNAFGSIGASTYDLKGERVGPAAMQVLRLDDGHVRIEASSSIEGAERTVVTAELAPTDDGVALRPLRQESRSFDATGAPLGIMTIDHEVGIATCAAPGGSERVPQRLELPGEERVANVLLNLVFQPLIRGETREVDFQIFVCRGGPRIMQGEAVVEGPRPVRAGQATELVEVSYSVDLGPLLSRLARPFLPRLSSWFDPTASSAWVGHRMPLFSNGPTVLVVRTGISPDLLTHSP